MTVQVCPECGALQGDRERCRACGATLAGPVQPRIQSAEPLGGLHADRTAFVNIGLYVLAMMIGIILLGVICVLVVQWVL